jgi:glycosyltransferase involved in cell wall biosynthesis
MESKVSSKQRKKLSVVIAIRNEQSNIGDCIKSVENIADEIVVVDDGSKDRGAEIAKRMGARVYRHVHKVNFHESKQYAIEKATGDWILQLDADERVTTPLAEEIKAVIAATGDELLSKVISGDRGSGLSEKQKLFLRYQNQVRKLKGVVGGDNGEVVAFFIPRLNFFLGRPLVHAGVYPDGVIRLFKKGKARLPAKSVHELMRVDGRVGWLTNDLEHHESPTLSRYLERANRYTDYTAYEFEKSRLKTDFFNFVKFSLLVPLVYFIKLYFRHGGYKDGMGGFVWSFFSALHFPISFFKYWQKNKK